MNGDQMRDLTGGCLRRLVQVLWSFKRCGMYLARGPLPMAIIGFSLSMVVKNHSESLCSCLLMWVEAALGLSGGDRVVHSDSVPKCKRCHILLEISILFAHVSTSKFCDIYGMIVKRLIENAVQRYICRWCPFRHLIADLEIAVANRTVSINMMSS